MTGTKRTLCFRIALAIISFSFVSAQTTVKLDIKPHNCPNPMNIHSPGLLPVVILGTEDFDVTNVDPNTVLLEGIAPVRWEFEDVSTLVVDGDPCECIIGVADGFMDLHLKFPTQELVASLEAQGSLEHGQEIVLTLTGTTYDGTGIEGSDCIIVIAKRSRPIDTPDLR